MMKFECLYYFTSTKLSVVEIKRTDQAKNAPLSDIYKWFVISMPINQVSELSFKSMDKNDFEESRSFMEGTIRFSDKEGSLDYLGENHSLVRRNLHEIPDNILSIIDKYLA